MRIHRAQYLRDTGRLVVYVPEISDCVFARIQYPGRVQKPTILNGNTDILYQAGQVRTLEFIPPETKRSSKKASLVEEKVEPFTYIIRDIRRVSMTDISPADVSAAGYESLRELLTDFTEQILPEFVHKLDQSYTEDRLWLSAWREGMNREARIRSFAWVLYLEKE